VKYWEIIAYKIIKAGAVRWCNAPAETGADEKLAAFVKMEAFDWGLYRATTAVGRRLTDKDLLDWLA
jgi:hypothetical protein